jgi:amidophosphoribosyltransferase
MAKIRDHCGVVAVAGPNAPVIAYDALLHLQHRGKESAGISFLGPDGIETTKGMGRIPDALDRSKLPLSPKAAIAHTRYSTSGSSSIDDAHPLDAAGFSLAFNGTITNFVNRGSTDTKFAAEFIERRLSSGMCMEETMRSFLSAADGAYSLLTLSENGGITAIRDPRGFKPLSVGRIGNNIVIASETLAITKLGGEVMYDVRPGEMTRVADGITRTMLVENADVAACSFEYVYFARSASKIDGVSVEESRIRIGRLLAENHGVDADVVIPILGSGRAFAIGYSEASGIRIEDAVVKLEDTRSFIDPNPDNRRSIVERKLAIVGDVERKRVVLVDDSIVRGDTMTVLISMFRNAGAAEVHVRIGSPPVIFPCYMGIDFPTREELMANRKSISGMEKDMGADSIRYITLSELHEGIERKDLCDACFSGDYPLRDSTLKTATKVAIRGAKKAVSDTAQAGKIFS